VAEELHYFLRNRRTHIMNKKNSSGKDANQKPRLHQGKTDEPSLNESKRETQKRGLEENERKQTIEQK
jgi:hypothetical protein